MHGHVIQPQSLCYLLTHVCLLAYGIHQMEVRIREKNGKGDAGEASACAQIHNLGAGLEVYEHGDAQ